MPIPEDEFEGLQALHEEFREGTPLCNGSSSLFLNGHTTLPSSFLLSSCSSRVLHNAKQVVGSIVLLGCSWGVNFGAEKSRNIDDIAFYKAFP